MDPTIIGSIGAGTADGIMGILGTLIQNRANRKEAEKAQRWAHSDWMRSLAYDQAFWAKQNKYNESRLEDQRNWDLAMWEKTNLYNSPAQQMARLKEAGLNPNLMYGQGTVGNAGSLTSDRVSAADFTPQGEAPYRSPHIENVMRGMHAFADMMDFRIKGAQVDNLHAQNKLIEQDALLRATQRLTEAGKAKKAHYDGEISEQTAQYQVEAAKHNLELLQRQVEEKDLAIEYQARTLGARIQRIFLENKGQQLTNQLRKLEADLNKEGIQKSDPVWLRAIIQAASGNSLLGRNIREYFNLD
jgi:hypothetical protein